MSFDGSPHEDSTRQEPFVIPPPVVYPSAPSQVGLMISRLLLVIALLVALIAMPYLVESVQFSLTRGRLRAQAEVADAQLIKYDKIADPAHAFKLIAQRMESCVVHINTQRQARAADLRDEHDFLLADPDRFQIGGEGSGVVVDPAGYIVTNHHVIDGAEEIQVVLGDDRIISAENVEIVGVDPLSDLAVLKVNAGKLVAATWGESEALEVGDWVVAVGAPFGLDRTVTAGIVSAKRKKFVDRSAAQDYLQTDVAVNPGNSGGPLVNLRGEVVGINTAIVGNAYQGISFAIPSDVAKSIYEQIKSNGRAVRGWLGVSMEKVSLEHMQAAGLAAPEGTHVSGVVEGSPADEAGIQAGDIIVIWDGKPVKNPRELSLAVASTPIDKLVTAEAIRGVEHRMFQVKVTDRPLNVNGVRR